MNRRIQYIFILCLCCLLGGCGLFSDSSSMYNGEIQEIDTAASFEITLPADWRIAEDDERSFSALSADGSLGIYVIAEFGGFTFYSMEELGEKVLDYVKLDDLSVSFVQAGLNETTQLHQILNFTDADGNAAIIDNYIFSPHTSVVYYVFLTASAADYDIYSKQFTEILNSFKLTKNREEYYEMIENMNEEKFNSDEQSENEK